MRAAAFDDRLRRYCSWEGAINKSPSVLRVGGAVVRRNLASDPRSTGSTKVSDGRWRGGLPRRTTGTTYTWTDEGFVTGGVDVGDYIAVTVRLSLTGGGTLNSDTPIYVSGGANPITTKIIKSEIVDNGNGTLDLRIVVQVIALKNGNRDANVVIQFMGINTTSVLLIGDLLIEKSGMWRPWFSGNTTGQDLLDIWP